MSYFNKVILVGRITRDPDIRFTTSGRSVTAFNLAVNRTTRQDVTEDQQTTDFIRIVCFGKLADFARTYLKKGQLILVEGELRLQKWQAKDGTNRTTAEIWARDIRFLEKKAAEEPDFLPKELSYGKGEEISQPEEQEIDNHYSDDSLYRRDDEILEPEEHQVDEHDPDEPPF
ncbi:MAG: single-stranded DNA-binding protein [Pseudothermotoga sp.]